MATSPELIYCANGNSEFARIAIEAGYTYGAQLPGTVYHPPAFADQDWKKPNRAAYMVALAQHRPRMASVLDWERREQFVEVLQWAEEIAQWVDVVMIIPKVFAGSHPTMIFYHIKGVESIRWILLKSFHACIMLTHERLNASYGASALASPLFHN